MKPEDDSSLDHDFEIPPIQTVLCGMTAKQVEVIPSSERPQEQAARIRRTQVGCKGDVMAEGVHLEQPQEWTPETSCLPQYLTKAERQTIADAHNAALAVEKKNYAAWRLKVNEEHRQQFDNEREKVAEVEAELEQANLDCKCANEHYSEIQNQLTAEQKKVENLHKILGQKREIIKQLKANTQRVVPPTGSHTH